MWVDAGTVDIIFVDTSQVWVVLKVTVSHGGVLGHRVNLRLGKKIRSYQIVDCGSSRSVVLTFITVDD